MSNVLILSSKNALKNSQFTCRFPTITIPSQSMIAVKSISMVPIVGHPNVLLSLDSLHLQSTIGNDRNGFTGSFLPPLPIQNAYAAPKSFEIVNKGSGYVDGPNVILHTESNQGGGSGLILQCEITSNEIQNAIVVSPGNSLYNVNDTVKVLHEDSSTGVRAELKITELTQTTRPIQYEPANVEYVALNNPNTIQLSSLQVSLRKVSGQLLGEVNDTEAEVVICLVIKPNDTEIARARQLSIIEELVALRKNQTIDENVNLEEEELQNRAQNLL